MLLFNVIALVPHVKHWVFNALIAEMVGNAKRGRNMRLDWREIGKSTVDFIVMWVIVMLVLIVTAACIKWIIDLIELLP